MCTKGTDMCGLIVAIHQLSGGVYGRGSPLSSTCVHPNSYGLSTLIRVSIHDKVSEQFLCQTRKTNFREAFLILRNTIKDKFNRYMVITILKVNSAIMLVHRIAKKVEHIFIGTTLGSNN